MDFFDSIRAMVPWLSAREASDAFNEVEIALFDAHPEYLELPETEQNELVLQAFRKSLHVIRH